MEVVKFDNEKMSSLEISEITGKPHNDLLKAIREMETTWIKLGQGNFSQSSYVNKQNREMPMYQLTKTECLYISSKFNDELRGKIILRWEELEKGLIPQTYGAALMAAAKKQLQIELLEKEVEVSKKEIQIEKSKREVQQMLSEALWDKEDKYALIPKWRK